MKNQNITKTHFGIYGINIKDNKILLIKKTRGPYTGLYDLPGGSPETNEVPEETLIREIKEETNLDVTSFNFYKKTSIIFSNFTPQSNQTGVLEHTALLYHIQTSGMLSQDGDGIDSGGAVWVNINELNEKNATPYAIIGAKSKL
ncbi:MAG: NUDIX domain-containing protein [Alphaproteobacteria bacterium]|nr:NUDIX domain-containing protein [Alphaproteobacteria bacterium]